jgi:hypothetical protein
VAAETGFGDSATEHLLAGSPLADYAVAGIDSPVLSTAIVGLLGCALTFILGWAANALVKRLSARRQAQ